MTVREGIFTERHSRRSWNIDANQVGCVECCLINLEYGGWQAGAHQLAAHGEGVCTDTRHAVIDDHMFQLTIQMIPRCGTMQIVACQSVVHHCAIAADGQFL